MGRDCSSCTYWRNKHQGGKRYFSYFCWHKIKWTVRWPEIHTDWLLEKRFDPLKQHSGGRAVKEQQWEHCPALRSRVEHTWKGSVMSMLQSREMDPETQRSFFSLPSLNRHKITLFAWSYTLPALVAKLQCCPCCCSRKKLHFKFTLHDSQIF